MVLQSRWLFGASVVVWAMEGLVNAQYGLCPDVDNEEEAKCEHGSSQPTCCQSDAKLRRNGDDDAYIHLLTCGEDNKYKLDYCEDGCYNGACNPARGADDPVQGGTCEGLKADMKCESGFKSTCCDNPDKDSENDKVVFTCDAEKGTTIMDECSSGCKEGKCNAPTDEKGNLRYGKCNDFNEGDATCNYGDAKNGYPMCCQAESLSKRQDEDGVSYVSITCEENGLLRKNPCSAGCSQGQCNAPTTYGTCKDLNTDSKCDAASYPQCCRLPYSNEKREEDDGMVYYSQTCSGDGGSLKRERCEAGCSSGKCNAVAEKDTKDTKDPKDAEGTKPKDIDEYDKDSFNGDSSDPCNYFDANDYCSDDDELPRCCKGGKSVRDSKKGSWSLSCVNNSVQKHTCSDGCTDGECKTEFQEGEYGTCPDLNNGSDCREGGSYPSCCKVASNVKRNGGVTSFYALTCTDGKLAREACSGGCSSGQCNAATTYGKCPDFNEGRECDTAITYPTCCLRSSRKRASKDTAKAQYSLTCPNGDIVEQEVCPDGCEQGSCVQAAE